VNELYGLRVVLALREGMHGDFNRIRTSLGFSAAPMRAGSESRTARVCSVRVLGMRQTQVVMTHAIAIGRNVGARFKIFNQIMLGKWRGAGG